MIWCWKQWASNDTLGSAHRISKVLPTAHPCKELVPISLVLIKKLNATPTLWLRITMAFNRFYSSRSQPQQPQALNIWLLLLHFWQALLFSSFGFHFRNEVLERHVLNWIWGWMDACTNRTMNVGLTGMYEKTHSSIYTAHMTLHDKYVQLNYCTCMFRWGKTSQNIEKWWLYKNCCAVSWVRMNPFQEMEFPSPKVFRAKDPSNQSWSPRATLVLATVQLASSANCPASGLTTLTINRSYEICYCFQNFTRRWNWKGLYSPA